MTMSRMLCATSCHTIMHATMCQLSWIGSIFGLIYLNRIFTTCIWDMSIVNTRCIARAFARLVFKIYNLHVVISLFKYYTILLLYINMIIIVNYALLLVKTIQIWSANNNNLICWALIILCIKLFLFLFYFNWWLLALVFINRICL